MGGSDGKGGAMPVLNDDIPNPDHFNGDDGGDDTSGHDFDGLLGGSDTPPGWLSDEELAHVRSEVPIAYVGVVPVRVDAQNRVMQVGTLTRVTEGEQGRLSRTLVMGRIRINETIRQALLRSVRHDLGDLADPRLPLSLQPFTVAEFFPSPLAPLHDARQHAIALCYVVALEGTCAASDDALDLEWTEPAKLDGAFYASMPDGQDRILRAGLSWAGAWRV